MEKKENKQRISKAIIILIVIIAITISLGYIKYRKGLTLIQLHDNSPRQMMGYVLVMKNKTIVIDGGLKEDASNLIDNVNRVGRRKNRCMVYNTSTYGPCRSIYGNS